MYKTIIIIIIIIFRRPIIIGLSNCPAILPQCALHTHAQMRIKAKVYFGRPRLHTVIKRARGQSRTPSECRQFFETAQVKLVVLRMCWARPSALFCGWVYFECCADEAVRETEQNAESEEAFRLLLLIGNVLKTDSKTKPTSKLNCRVIIFIYKLGCQECKKRHLLDIFLNSFELWMNMTKLHRQHFVFFTAH